MTASSFATKPLLKSLGYTILLSVAFVIVTRVKQSMNDILIALPFFIIFYFLLFSIGKPEVSDLITTRIKRDVRIALLFPLLIILIFILYIVSNGQSPFTTTFFLLPYLLFFPVMAFMGMQEKQQRIGWFDFTVFFLFFIPVTLISIQPAGNLPIHGGGFDSVYRIAIMLTAVFAFVTVRGIRDVGFYPVFNIKKAFTVLWVWAIFYSSIILIAYPIDFIKFKGDSAVNVFIPMLTAKKFLAILLHTALFEELVFRGLLLRMLARRIEEGGNWKVFLKWGFVLLFLLSLIVGFSMKGPMQWFPAVITIALCAAAFALEKKQWHTMGAYTALALSSVFFGLVHMHSGSVIFVGLAAIGGWAYGYTYLKTNNVFYAALLHALVNATPMLFGLELAK